MFSFTVNTLMFICCAICCGVVFLAAFSAFFFPFAERRPMPKTVTFIALVKVPLGCVALDLVFDTVNDKASLDAFIGGILILGIDLE